MPARDSVRAKLRRAEMHLGCLEDLVDEFIRRKPYTLAFKPHRFAEPGDPEQYEVVVEACDPIPEPVLLAAGDFLTNLRAALDHLAWTLVLADGGTPTERTMFPILRSEPARGIYVVGGVSAEALALMDAAQPYKRRDGNPEGHPLWILDRLVGIDKHRHLLLTTLGHQSVTFELASGRGDTFFFDHVAPLEPGTSILTIAFGDMPKVDVNADLTATVALQHTEPGGRQSLCGLFQTLLEETSAVIDSFGL